MQLAVKAAREKAFRMHFLRASPSIVNVGNQAVLAWLGRMVEIVDKVRGPV